MLYFLRLCFVVFAATAVPSTQSVAWAKSLDLTVNAEAAILMNADTGAILYAKNARTLYYPASITKIATAIYALKVNENKLDEKVVAEQEAIGWASEGARRSNYTNPPYLLVQGSTHIGLKKGEILSLRDLLYGLMLASGNDAANVIAHYSAGSITRFMEQVNAYLKEIGCLSTTFQNPHGLHHPNHQTTAYDMAILTREAMKHPLFREIVATTRYKRPKTNKQEASTFVQGNKLLRQGVHYYSKAIGVKTGYHSIAGNTFVGAASDGNRTLIAVLLKEEERKNMFADAIKMFEAAFSQPKIQRTLLRSGNQKFVLELEGAQQKIETYITEDLSIEYYSAEEPAIKCFLTWDNDIKLPIVKGQRLGEISVEIGNALSPEQTQVEKIAIYARDDIAATWSFWVKSLFR